MEGADRPWWRSPMGVAGALAGVAVKASIGAAALGVTLVAALAVFQRKIMYFPQAGTIPPPPERLKAPYNEIEDVEVVTEDGVRIKLWYWAAQEGARGFVTPETAKSREKTAMLLFHGNAGSRADRAQWALQLRQLHGVAVCLVDYRGYGGSEGEPTEAGMRADSRAALKWLRETKRPEKIVLLGESIGTCVSVALAEEEGPGGVDALILNAALTSITEVAASIYPFLKPCLKLLLRDKWDSLGKINKVEAPLLFLHGPHDNIVPIDVGRRLFEASNEPKRFVTIPRGDHNNLPFIGGEQYYSAIEQHLRQHVDP